jgi:hypothetical protein
MQRHVEHGKPERYTERNADSDDHCDLRHREPDSECDSDRSVSLGVELPMYPNAKTLRRLCLNSTFPHARPNADLVKRNDSPSNYQITHTADDGKTVTLCLMHGGSPTNFELRNIPVENLIWQN